MGRLEWKSGLTYGVDWVTSGTSYVSDAVSLESLGGGGGGGNIACL